MCIAISLPQATVSILQVYSARSLSSFQFLAILQLSIKLIIYSLYYYHDRETGHHILMSVFLKESVLTNERQEAL